MFLDQGRIGENDRRKGFRWESQELLEARSDWVCGFEGGSQTGSDTFRFANWFSLIRVSRINTTYKGGYVEDEAFPRELGARRNTTMERRKFIAGLGSLTAAGAAGIGTGAFTSVSAGRSVDVDTAGDADAFLAMEPSPGAGGDYAETEDEQLQINLDGSAEGVSGEGVNDDAVTNIRDVFRMRNQGTQSVYVYIEDSSDAVTFKLGPSPAMSDREIFDSPISRVQPNEIVDVDGSENAVKIAVGQEVAIHMHIDTTGKSTPKTLLEDVTVHAVATAPEDSPFAD